MPNFVEAQTLTVYHVHAANVSAIPTDMDTGDAPGDLLHGKGVVFKPGKVVFFLSKFRPGKLFFAKGEEYTKIHRLNCRFKDTRILTNH